MGLMARAGSTQGLPSAFGSFFPSGRFFQEGRSIERPGGCVTSIIGFIRGNKKKNFLKTGNNN
jgi:hypothetical protein